MRPILPTLLFSLTSLSLTFAQTATTPPRSTATNVQSGNTFSRWCSKDNVICVAAIPLPSAVNPTSIQFTMWSPTALWLGFGLGSSMSDADVYIGWNSAIGKRMIVSDRTATGQFMPTADAASGITVQNVPPQLSFVAANRTVVSFSRPLTAIAPNKPITPGGSSYIWAYGLTKPTQDVPGSTFTKHDAYGSIVFDFLNVGGNQQAASNGPIWQVPNASVIHGIFMTIAWTVCPMAGIFVARYLKDMMGKWWYYTHLGLMLGGSTIIGTFGIVFIILTSSPPHFTPSTPHKPIGLAIGIDAILQAILGFICNHLWSPDRRSIPWWDRLHWWNGRLLTILALVNTYLGLRLANAGLALTVGFFVFVGVGSAVLVAGQFYFGQVNHMKKDDEKEIGMSYNQRYGGK